MEVPEDLLESLAEFKKARQYAVLKTSRRRWLGLFALSLVGVVAASVPIVADLASRSIDLMNPERMPLILLTAVGLVVVAIATFAQARKLLRADEARMFSFRPRRAWPVATMGIGIVLFSYFLLLGHPVLLRTGTAGFFYNFLTDSRVLDGMAVYFSLEFGLHAGALILFIAFGVLRRVRSLLATFVSFVAAVLLMVLGPAIGISALSLGLYVIAMLYGIRRYYEPPEDLAR